MLLGDYVPVLNGHVATIVNDQYPVAFKIRDGSSFSLITQDTVTRLKIDVPDDASTTTYTLTKAAGEKRSIKAKIVTLSRLRFGSHVLHDVKVGVLTGDDVDIGNQLAPKIFHEGHVRHEMSKFLFKVEGKKKILQPPGAIQ